MSIPSYEEIMAPLLRLCSDGMEHKFAELVDRAAQHFQLTEAERAELLPGGTQARFRNRVGWARSYLVQAGLLKAVKRGVVQITQRGMQAVQSGAIVKNDYLIQFPEFQEFRTRSSVTSSSPRVLQPGGSDTSESITPEEELIRAYEELRTALVSDAASRAQSRVVLIDGRQLSELMVEHGVGVSTSRLLPIRKVDSDYFED